MAAGKVVVGEELVLRVRVEPGEAVVRERLLVSPPPPLLSGRFSDMQLALLRSPERWQHLEMLGSTWVQLVQI